jgi:hypothetical protein
MSALLKPVISLSGVCQNAPAGNVAPGVSPDKFQRRGTWSADQAHRVIAVHALGLVQVPRATPASFQNMLMENCAVSAHQLAANLTAGR